MRLTYWNFSSTIKLSALRGTYSRVVARVFLLNADLPRKKKRFTEIRDYPAVVSSLHDFIVRICDCKMDSQNLYRPGSQVRRKCKRKGSSHVHAVFTLRLYCSSLHVWRVNRCVNPRAQKKIKISLFLESALSLMRFHLC